MAFLEGVLVGGTYVPVCFPRRKGGWWTLGLSLLSLDLSFVRAAEFESHGPRLAACVAVGASASGVPFFFGELGLFVPLAVSSELWGGVGVVAGREGALAPAWDVFHGEAVEVGAAGYFEGDRACHCSFSRVVWWVALPLITSLALFLGPLAFGVVGRRRGSRSLRTTSPTPCRRRRCGRSLLQRRRLLGLRVWGACLR